MYNLLTRVADLGVPPRRVVLQLPQGAWPYPRVAPHLLPGACTALLTLGRYGCGAFLSSFALATVGQGGSSYIKVGRVVVWPLLSPLRPFLPRGLFALAVRAPLTFQKTRFVFWAPRTAAWLAQTVSLTVGLLLRRGSRLFFPSPLASCSVLTNLVSVSRLYLALLSCDRHVIALAPALAVFIGFVKRICT